MTDVQSRSMRQAWVMVCILCLANAFSFTDRFLIALLAQPIKVSFGISDTSLGLLQGATFGIFYAALGLPLAWVADRTVRRNVIAAGSALWSLATILAGVVVGYPAFFLTRTGVAIGEATLSPSAFSMISDSFPARRLSLPMGIFASGVAIGTGASFIFGGALYEYFKAAGGWTFPVAGHCEPWQCVFIAIGLIGLVVPLLLIAMVREPERRGLTSNADSGSFREFAAFVLAERRILWPIVLGFALATFASAGIAAWTPTVLIRNYGMNIGEVGAWLGSIYLVSGIVGSILGGSLADLADSWGAEHGKLVVASGAIGLQILPNVIGPLSGSATVTLICYSITVILGQAVAAPTAAALQLLTPNRMRAKVNASYYFVFNVIGIGLGPVAAAFISDEFFPGVSGLSSGIAIVAAIGGPVNRADVFGLPCFPPAAGPRDCCTGVILATAPTPSKLT